MTQANPYAPFPGEPSVEPRTSVMAILALIASLVCFIPGLPLIGVLLAIFALIAISNSNGRTSGRGLAIAALIIGLVLTAIQGAIVLGAVAASKAMQGAFAGPITQLMTDIEAKNYTAARAGFTGPAGARISDADFDRFVAGYQAELGSFKGGPDGMIDLFKSYGGLGQQMQQFQGKPGQATSVIPFPGKFDNGLAVIALQLDTNTSTPGKGVPFPVANIMIITPKGSKVILYDPQAQGAMPPPPVDTSGGTPTAPSDPNAPSDPSAPPTPPGGN